MSATCPKCNCESVTCIASGAIVHAHRCETCSATWERMAPSAKRLAIIGVISLFTSCIDGGVIGSAIASFFGGSDDS